MAAWSPCPGLALRPHSEVLSLLRLPSVRLAARLLPLPVAARAPQRGPCAAWATDPRPRPGPRRGRAGSGRGRGRGTKLGSRWTREPEAGVEAGLLSL